MTTFGPRIEYEEYFTSSPFEPLTGPITSVDDIDLTDHKLYTEGDFHTALRLLRKEAPIFWHSKGTAKAFGDKPFWAVTTYDGFNKVIQNGKLFSSVHPVIDRTSEELGLHGFIFALDGDAHRSYRSVIERYTNLKAVKSRQAAMDKSIRDDIAAFAKNGGTDLAPLAYRIQAGLGLAFYDLEGEEANRLRVIAEKLITASLNPGITFSYDGSEVLTSLIQLIEDILVARRKKPKDDIFTGLNADEDAGKLTHDQVLTYLWFTTSNVVGTAANAAIYNPMIAVLHHPEQFKLMRENPELIDNGNAADEALRWGGNSMHLCRQALADTEVLGQPIKKGEVVVAFQASANRDETVFEDPYRFDVAKKRRRNLTFGTGMHQCIGMYMMQATATSVLRGLAESFERIEQTGRIIHHIPYSLFNTEVASMPMRGIVAQIGSIDR